MGPRPDSSGYSPEKRYNHPKCGRNWYACVTIHGHCSGGVAMMVWWPCGARTLVRISEDILIPMWGTIPYRLGNLEDGWPFASGRGNGLRNPEGGWYPWVSSDSSSCELHGYFSSVNLLACVNCYNQWGIIRVHQKMKWWCFWPLLCTLLRLNWAKQTPGIMRRH